jgi:transcriptional regulator with PAS, ATPase and Fis domain
MPLVMQVKLLRVLQEREFERIGGTRTLPLDIRVVAATKVPLKELVRQGRFREDLYYRIAVVPILLPPLRARTGDVPLLAAALIERHGRARSYRIARSTLAMMERYAWPGNVRELENAIQRAIALAGEQSELALEDLVPVDPRWRGAAEASPGIEPLRVVLHEAERAHLLRALEATGGHKSQTAQLLGISRKVLWEKLREHGLQASSPNTDEEES